jgi:hypothetical protein
MLDMLTIPSMVVAFLKSVSRVLKLKGSKTIFLFVVEVTKGKLEVSKYRSKRSIG